MEEPSRPTNEQQSLTRFDGGTSEMSRAGPALNQFAGLGYLFLFVSMIDVGSDTRNILSGVFAPIAGGVYPGTVMLGILLVGAIAVLGLYFRKTWGLIGFTGVFGFYTMLMFYAAEWTIAGVAFLCVLYLLSRVDVVRNTTT